MPLYQIKDEIAYNFVGCLADCKWWLVQRYLDNSNTLPNREIVWINENCLQYRVISTKQVIQTHTLLLY